MSLPNNEITSLDEIQKLRDLQKLEHLRLEGNPITSYPNFRKVVITLVQQLRQLDGEHISEEERREAEIVTNK